MECVMMAGAGVHVCIIYRSENRGINIAGTGIRWWQEWEKHHRGVGMTLSVGSRANNN